MVIAASFCYELKVNGSFILTVVWEINRNVGCWPGLISMQYAGLHFVWRSTELTRAAQSLSKSSTLSVDIADG